ncbi:hypothetical protein EPO33_05390 [Patescibacteria group bacterium]|nr:MAG: hypothetical protein EPO33_05390 [Patescibacteria group bacterium]
MLRHYKLDTQARRRYLGTAVHGGNEMAESIEIEKGRTPRNRDRTSVLQRKVERKAARDKVLSDALHSRITGVLERLVGRGDIKWFVELGKRPADPRVTVTFRIGRKGTVKPIERDFVVATDMHMARIVLMEIRCAVISVPPEMRDERIAERILALFKN